MQLFLIAISLGLISGFHCIGMCGPIALALPVYHLSPLKKNLGILLYNFGRALTYSILGLFFGLIGETFFIWGLQQFLSIALGIFMLLFLFSNTLFSNFSFFNSAISKLKQQLKFSLRQKNIHYLFLIGLLNGFLPCGMVYMAIAGALATHSVFNGALFMFYFGLATFPFMMGISFFRNFFTTQLKFNSIKPIIIATMALLFILRGLNLGIPYISPKMESSSKVDCCEKNQSIMPIRCAVH